MRQDIWFVTSDGQYNVENYYTECDSVFEQYLW